MKENIHLKISASDKQELAEKARELGLSLSAYIRLRLKEASLPREVTLREIYLTDRYSQFSISS